MYMRKLISKQKQRLIVFKTEPLQAVYKVELSVSVATNGPFGKINLLPSVWLYMWKNDTAISEKQ